RPSRLSPPSRPPRLKPPPDPAPGAAAKSTSAKARVGKSVLSGATSSPGSGGGTKSSSKLADTSADIADPLSLSLLNSSVFRSSSHFPRAAPQSHPRVVVSYHSHAPDIYRLHGFPQDLSTKQWVNGCCRPPSFPQFLL